MAKHLFALGTGRNWREELEQGTSVGKRYRLVNAISRVVAQKLKEQTGYTLIFPEGKSTVKPNLGQGFFGKIRLAYDVETQQFLGVKKIKGFHEIAESQEEGFLQWQLKGKPHIMPLLDSVETESKSGEKVLYQFMPLATLGNGEDFACYLGHVQDDGLKMKLFIHFAKGLLTGIQHMHAADIYHLDIKPSNVVLDHQGMLYIIDFGCAKQIEPRNPNNNNTIPIFLTKALGDYEYFSPERLWDKKQGACFEPAPAEIWQLGLCLVQIWTGQNPLSNNNLNESFLDWGVQQFERCLEQVPELQQPTPSSIWALIKGLLAVHPGQRLTLEQALKAPVFQVPVFACESEQKAAFQAIQQQATALSASRSPAVNLSKAEDPRYQGVVPRHSAENLMAVNESYGIDSKAQNSSAKKSHFFYQSPKISSDRIAKLECTIQQLTEQFQKQIQEVQYELEQLKQLQQAEEKNTQILRYANN